MFDDENDYVGNFANHRNDTVNYVKYHDIASASHTISSPPLVASATSSVAKQNVAYYYASCYAAGGASSCIRWLMNPLDLVKTRMQVDTQQRYPNLYTGLRIIMNENGVKGLFQGLGPTAIAYMFQTSIKYGTYEYLKGSVIPHAVSDDFCQKHSGLVYVSAAACAEIVADVFMCPWEMLKVKVQTAGVVAPAFVAAKGSVSTMAFPTTSTFGGLKHMIQYHKEYKFPFGSLGPLMFRQVPSTIVNFYIFENVSNLIYNKILSRSTDQRQARQTGSLAKSDHSMGTQLSVTVISGYIAGFVSTLISHPADSLVSLMNQPKYRSASIWQIIQDVGFVKLATNGLVPRILVTGQIICTQWFLYDLFKNLLLGKQGMYGV